MSLEIPNAHKPKTLEKENTRLKSTYAYSAMDKQTLKDMFSKVGLCQQEATSRKIETRLQRKSQHGLQNGNHTLVSELLLKCQKKIAKSQHFCRNCLVYTPPTILGQSKLGDGLYKQLINKCVKVWRILCDERLHARWFEIVAKFTSKRIIGALKDLIVNLSKATIYMDK